MKKLLTTLTLLAAVLFSAQSFAASSIFHKKEILKSHISHQTSPSLTADDIIRLKAFKAFTQARRHHLELLASGALEK